MCTVVVAQAQAVCHMFAGELAGAPSEDEQPVMGQTEEDAAAPLAESTPSTAEENANSPTGVSTFISPITNPEDDENASPPEFPSSLPPSLAEENATSPTGASPSVPPITSEEDVGDDPVSSSIAEEQDSPTAAPSLVSSANSAEERIDSPPVQLHPFCPPANSAEAPTSTATTDDAAYGDEVTGHMVSIHERTSSPNISLNVQVSPSACTL